MKLSISGNLVRIALPHSHLWSNAVIYLIVYFQQITALQNRPEKSLPPKYEDRSEYQWVPTALALIEPCGWTYIFNGLPYNRLSG